MSQNETKKTTAKKAETKKETVKKTNDTPGRNPDGTFANGHDFSEKYDDKYADMLIDFFSQPLTRTEFKRTYNRNGDVESEYPIEFVNDFPTMGMFARSIGVSVSALKSWAGITYDGKYKHDHFALAYARVKEWAGGMMESGALSGKLDTNMAKFVLTNDYGKQDKQVIDTRVTGIDEKDLALIQRVEARLREQNGDKS
jgi:hypothetical protein